MKYPVKILSEDRSKMFQAKKKKEDGCVPSKTIGKIPKK